MRNSRFTRVISSMFWDFSVYSTYQKIRFPGTLDILILLKIYQKFLKSSRLTRFITKKCLKISGLSRVPLKKFSEIFRVNQFVKINNREILDLLDLSKFKMAAGLLLTDLMSLHFLVKNLTPRPLSWVKKKPSLWTFSKSLLKHHLVPWDLLQFNRSVQFTQFFLIAAWKSIIRSRPFESLFIADASSASRNKIRHHHFPYFLFSQDFKIPNKASKVADSWFTGFIF